MRIIIMMIVMLYATQVYAQLESPVPDDQWNEDVKLWTARSVLGEVGWDRPGEWAAVLWVYANRASQSKQHTFYQMVRRYSAAVKSGNHHRNPWLFQLGFDKTRPRDWPVNEDGTGPRWRGLHDESWIRTLKFVDEWQVGKVSNPCPRANHFGGYVDRHRAETNRWTRIKCDESGYRKFRNYFYDSTRLQKEQVMDWRFNGFGKR